MPAGDWPPFPPELFPFLGVPFPNPASEETRRQLDEKVSKLTQELERMLDQREIKDHDRMNWIEKHPGELILFRGEWYVESNHQQGFRTAREAIDNAIEKERLSRSIEKINS